jgi:nicotinate-nucleotide--dimethylbenzimidazole phosphoribosyltransferase
MIKDIHEYMRAQITTEINEKTKPLQSLGQIEELALQIALVQGTLKPKIVSPTLIVMAGDHGIARAGVSPYPQSVTAAMVANFASGGAAVNVFTKLLGWKLELINCGTVSGDEIESVISLHAGRGTQNFLEEKAMTSVQRALCMEAGRNRIDLHAAEGSNTVGFGEMGIGNTSSAALLIHCLSSLPLETVVGRGAGCDDEQLLRKQKILKDALIKHGRISDPLLALETYGGFEIACMTGAMLRAAERQMLVMVDGLIASSAALLAIRIDPRIKPYLVFAHESEVSGHRELLSELGVKALLNLSMRLGEGTGVALALPLVQAAAAMLTDMATFTSASVSKKGEE